MFRPDVRSLRLAAIAAAYVVPPNWAATAPAAVGLIVIATWLVLIASFMLASYHAIEAPGIALGRLVFGFLSRRFAPQQARGASTRAATHREADQPWKLSTADARKIGVSRAGAKLCKLKSRSNAGFAVVQPAADRVPIYPAEDHQKKLLSDFSCGRSSSRRSRSAKAEAHGVVLCETEMSRVMRDGDAN